MLLLITLFLGCVEEMSPEDIRKTNMRNRCRSKVKGSSPSCWNEDDWKAFCQRVHCKPQEKSHEE